MKPLPKFWYVMGISTVMDKAAAANSLFGGENQVDIATPEIIPSPAWGIWNV